MLRRSVTVIVLIVILMAITGCSARTDYNDSLFLTVSEAREKPITISLKAAEANVCLSFTGNNDIEFGEMSFVSYEDGKKVNEAIIPNQIGELYIYIISVSDLPFGEYIGEIALLDGTKQYFAITIRRIIFE